MTFCQPTVLGLMLFHVQDEPDLSAWQSGEFYVDGTPKASLVPVRSAAFSVRRGIAASCPGLLLTPKLKLAAGKPTKTGAAGDAHLLARLHLHGPPGRQDARSPAQPSAASPRSCGSPASRRRGGTRWSGSATAALNAGPPGRAALTFRL